MIEIVRGCLVVCMMKIVKRGVELFYKILLRKVCVWFRGVGIWIFREKDWDGLYFCMLDLMVFVCDKEDLFLFEIYY